MTINHAGDEYEALRAAFHAVAEGLMAWQDPPLMGRREYARLEELDAAPIVYRPYDPQGEVEPYDVDADWEERA